MVINMEQKKPTLKRNGLLNKYSPCEPINRPILNSKNTEERKMYKVHKYWARKPWSVVNKYISHFTKEGELILDPFAGSGVTGIEAIANKRKAILIDLNPAAVFIAKNTSRTDFDLEDLEKAFDTIRLRCEKRIRKLYCLEEKCPSCKANLEMRHLCRGPKFPEWIVYGTCPNCGDKKHSIKRVLITSELKYLQNIEKKRINHWYPKNAFPESFDKDRISYKGIKHIYQLFTKRNLCALSILWSQITEIDNESVRDLLKLSFLNTLLHVSKLKAENVRPMAVNNYWVPDDWIEENVWFRFNERFSLLKNGKRICLQRIKPLYYNFLRIYNASALNLNRIKNNTIDYIFTDPPYGGGIQYIELSMIWNAWLGNLPSNKEEIVINPTQNKGVDQYGQLLEVAFKEMFRVLKYGRWVSVCFHNTEFKVWSTILRACKKAGFILINAVPQEPLTQAFTQSWSRHASKTDFIINLIKPFPEDKNYLLDKLGNNGKNDINVIINNIIKNSNALKQNITEIYDKILVKIIGKTFFSENQFENSSLSIYMIDEILTKLGDNNGSG